MQTYEMVRAQKEAQRKAAAANSVHRSSLLIPAAPVDGVTRTLTLSNHFKIKRGIDAVGMRIWGFDQQGSRVFGDHLVLDSPRVYRYELDAAGLVAATYQVEFFSASNLGVPYPAAIVNYSGAGFHNAVHAFARVLNDVFEDATVNAVKVAEASIDVCVDEDHDTFLSFLTGPHGLSAQAASVGLRVRMPGGTSLDAAVPVSGARFATTTVRLSEAFKAARLPLGTVLKVDTPEQPMFFGRMMGGICRRRDGALSANHTYYDNSLAREYTSAPYGYSHCTLFEGLSTRLIFYPIQAPSRLELFVEYYEASGQRIGTGPSTELSSPSGDAAIIDVSGEAPAKARSFRVIARPVGSSELPARISHQVVIGGRGLSGSVNKSLEFPDEQNVEASPERPFVSWIQGVHGEQKVTRIDLTAMRAEQQQGQTLEYAIYDETGLVRQEPIELAPYCSRILDSRDIFGVPAGPDRYFYVYTSSLKTRIRMYSVTECLDSGHCSAEHNF